MIILASEILFFWTQSSSYQNEQRYRQVTGKYFRYPRYQKDPLFRLLLCTLNTTYKSSGSQPNIEYFINTLELVSTKEIIQFILKL